MKKILVILWAVMICHSCYKEDIDQLFSDQQKLESELSVLRELCEQANHSVELLKNLINGSMIKAATPFEDAAAGASGWEISFTDGTSFRIYNGKDSHTPVIGVQQLEDGNWYWTLDSLLLKDEHQQPIRANGQDGTAPTVNAEGYWVINGIPTQIKATGETPTVAINAEGYWVINGTATTVKAEGNSAAEPQLVIGADLIDQGIVSDKQGVVLVAQAWYLSVDGGNSWARVSGIGSGGGGSSLIQEVNESPDGNSITFILANGQSIVVPSWAWAQQQVDELKQRIETLENLATGKYISSVDTLWTATKTIAGWSIKYSDGTHTEIYNGEKGADGTMPAISIAPEGNDYYWTVNGEKVLDVDGQPVKANAKRPQIQLGEALTGNDAEGNLVEAGVWYLSVDGENWCRISGAKGDQGDAFFSQINSTHNEYVEFVLIDGTTLQIPKYEWVKNEFSTMNQTIEGLATLLQERKFIQRIDTLWADAAKQYIAQYTITFSDHTFIEISNSIIGVTPIGGDLFWTLNGEPIRFNGQMIKANAVDGSSVPLLRLGSQLPAGTVPSGGEAVISTAYYLSVDNGITWTRVSGDKGEQGAPGNNGSNAACIFSKVETSADGYWVTFTLQDRGEIIVPTQAWSQQIRQELDQLKATVQGIQDLINSGKVITKVENLPNGYKITYSDGTFSELFNGTDGLTPTISIGQVAGDDNFYWKVNDNFLENERGEKIRANGQNGADGTPGTNGTNAPTPRIELGSALTGTDAQGNPFIAYACYLSVDDGAHWYKVSGEKGDPGEAGTPGTEGDRFIKSITTSENGYWVTFTLQDGSLLEIPTKKWQDAVDASLQTINQNMQNIQNLLAQGMIIKSIDPYTEGDKTGWKIICLNANGEKQPPYLILNGTDGKDGAAGQEPATPTIKIGKDAANPSDENLYWIVNDAFLLDENGQKVRANGQDGASATTPILKVGADLDAGIKDVQNQDILPHAFYLSVDNGASWAKVSGNDGQQGEQGNQGDPGEKGDPGDSFFSKVDATTSGDYVEFTLSADNSTFKVPKYKEITILFNETSVTIDKKTSKVINFNITGTYAQGLTATLIVGGMWKGSLNYDPAAGKGTITIQAPDNWDYNKIVLLVTDQKGNVWMNSLTVQCTWQRGDPFVDERDERVYSMFEFASVWWLTQDMKYNTSGGYTWEEAQTACPPGWHLPSDTEWETLKSNIDSDRFGNPTTGGVWWSSTPVSETQASVWAVNAPSLMKETQDKSNIRSVRCVKD